MAGNPDFQARGAEYLKTHPDLNERLAAAHTGGLTMDDAATWRILELGRPDIADWAVNWRRCRAGGTFGIRRRLRA
jgi:hypothetical protein